MGLIQRHGISSGIFIYMGIIIGFVNVTFLFPNIAGNEVFGFTRSFDEFAALFLLLGGFGTGVLSVKFFPHFRDKSQQHHGFLGFLFLLRTIGLVIAILAIYGVKQWVLNSVQVDNTRFFIQKYYYLLPLTIALATYTELLESYHIGLLRPRVSVFFREIGIRLTNTVLIGCLYFRWIDHHQFILLFSIRFIVALLGLLVFTIYMREWHWASGWDIFKKPIFKKMANYSFFSILSSLGSRISGKIDILMITSFLGLDAVAVYAVMSYVARVIQVPHEGISKIVSPLFAESWAHQDMAKIKELYKRTALNNFAIGLLIFIGIIANIQHFFALQKPIYAQYFYVFFFLGIAQLVNIINGYNGALINFSPKYQFDLISKALTAIIAIITNYYLINRYGLNGAAAATAMTLILVNLFIQGFIYWHFKLLPFSKNMLLVTMIGALTYWIQTILPASFGYWIFDLLLRSSILTFIYFSLLLSLRVVPDISDAFRTIMKKIF